MALVKCPRCELNYMESTEKYCKVCYREIHGSDMRDEPELCSVCNEAQALPGKDVCLFCLKEMLGAKEESDDAQPVDVADNSVSTMDEIAPGIGAEIPDPEYSEINKDLSLEEMEEKEENEGADEEEDD